jgi:hypothetical protein
MMLDFSTTGPVGGYESLQTMSESSFRHVREAAEALAETNLDATKAIWLLRSQRRDSAAWWLERFVRIL